MKAGERFPKFHTTWSNGHTSLKRVQQLVQESSQKAGRGNLAYHTKQGQFQLMSPESVTKPWGPSPGGGGVNSMEEGLRASSSERKTT